MNGHQVFKKPLRLVIMLIIGLHCILGDLLLAVLLGIGIYVAAVWAERLF